MSGNPVQGTSSVGIIADEAKEAATHVAQIAREQIGARAAAGKDRAAENLQGVASNLRSTGEQLPGPIPEYIDQAAGWVEGLAGYFRDRDIPTLFRDTERWARREPTIFLGGAFVLGLLGARFLKASGDRTLDSDLDRQFDALRTNRDVSGSHVSGQTGSSSLPRPATSVPRPAYRPDSPIQNAYPGSSVGGMHAAATSAAASASGLSPAAPPVPRTQVNVRTEGMTSASNNPSETSPGTARPTTQALHDDPLKPSAGGGRA